MPGVKLFACGCDYNDKDEFCICKATTADDVCADCLAGNHDLLTTENDA